VPSIRQEIYKATVIKTSSATIKCTKRIVTRLNAQAGALSIILFEMDFYGQESLIYFAEIRVSQSTDLVTLAVQILLLLY